MTDWEPDPAEWARPSDAEVLERERERRLSSRELWPGGPTLPRDPTVAFAPEATRVSFRRALAALIDVVVATLVLALPAGLIGAFSEPVAGAFYCVSLVIGVPAYFVLAQSGTGETIGKHMTRLKVVDAAGRPPSTGALIRRSATLYLEPFILLWIWASSDWHYRQRGGDLWAHTYVVECAYLATPRSKSPT